MDGENVIVIHDDETFLKEKGHLQSYNIQTLLGLFISLLLVFSSEIAFGVDLIKTTQADFELGTRTDLDTAIIHGDLNTTTSIYDPVGGSAPLALTNGSPTSTPVVFLIYIKNNESVSADDVRFQDILDISGTGFTYVSGTLILTSAISPPFKHRIRPYQFSMQPPFLEALRPLQTVWMRMWDRSVRAREPVPDTTWTE
jgi:hypothetical protein